MNLQGQHGYAMAVLLVTLSVMAILLSVAMPVWKHASQREKEAELVFRGQQYVHAIGLFQRKHGPGVLPPTVDVLVNEHFLRKKFKDPITTGDFQVLFQGAQAQAAPGTGAPGSNTPGSTALVAPVTAHSTTRRPAAGAAAVAELSNLAPLARSQLSHVRTFVS